ncbi:uncharacterized protein LOC129587627 [Paramacrobiotus metropolitanus]|uniref:uncharacterized protein LOC129587627 n=1 Tax=Paramacrobiotus metropolitanus TaxID=2943436 RepID=UPI00244628E8|nr:uncharacterized protein LOC129587627 [Paramacrobiotus metropolitanus]
MADDNFIFSAGMTVSQSVEGLAPANTESVETKLDRIVDETEYLHHNKLFQLCRPFLHILRLGGLFFINPGIHTRQPANTSVTPGDITPKSRGYQWRHRLEQFCRIYSIIIFLVTVAFSIHVICGVIAKFTGVPITYDNLGQLVNAVTFLLWIAQLLIVHVIMLRACWRKAGIVAFFMCWDGMRYRCAFDLCKCNNFAQKFDRKIKTLSVIAVVHLLIVIAGQVEALVIPTRGLRLLLLSAIPEEGVYQTVVMAFDVAASVYLSFVFVVPCYLFLAVSFLIDFDFFHLNYDMKSSVSAAELPAWIEWFRLRHNSLCVLLEEGDRLFAAFVLTTFTSNILQVLLIIFQLYDLGQKGLLEPILLTFLLIYLLTFFADIHDVFYWSLA